MSFLNETVARPVREIAVPEVGQEVVDQFVCGWCRQVLPGSLSTTGGVGSE
jgi:hypothetical protein